MNILLTKQNYHHKYGLGYNLDNSNLVGNIQGVIIRGQSDISLLVSGRSDQGVHLGHVDVVELLDSSLDLVLVGLDVTNEDQGVVVLNLLHGGLSGQRVLDYGVSIHLIPLWGGLAGVLGVPK